MDEKKILDGIVKSSKNIEIPEGLSPGGVGKMIKDYEGKKSEYTQKSTLGFLKYVAAFLLIIGGLGLVGFLNGNADSFRWGYKPIKYGSLALDSAVTAPKNYRDIYKAIKGLNRARKQERSSSYAWGLKGAVEESVEAPTASADAAGSSTVATSESTTNGMTVGENDYSDTNVQVQGVDEGDIVKTDGEYIYTLTNGAVRITKAEDGQLEHVGEFTVNEFNTNNTNMYIVDDKAIIVQGEYNTMVDGKTVYEKPDSYSPMQTVIRTYDLKDKSKPKLIGEVYQEGGYQQSRLKDGFIYIFSDVYKETYDFYSNKTTVQEKNITAYVPSVNGETVAPDDILIPDSTMNENYLSISSINLATPNEVVDTKSILSGANRIYVSNDYIYVEVYSYYDEQNATKLVKFAYKDGEILAKAAGAFKGYTTDDFAYDEYQGYLRVVTTDGANGNNLFVLDEHLNITGRITGLAPGENIKSARFMGDLGYFVTFRQMDPLFSVDLKDPENPKILGELKITGFSEYLHFYGENRLLGIGEEVNPQNGAPLGIKLSMFDISNPADVKEINKIIVEGIDYSAALYNYKSVMINGDKNIIGFNGMSYEEQAQEMYFIYSYDEEKGFIKQFQVSDLDLPMGNQGVTGEDFRGLYINQYLYVVNKEQIVSYDMNNSYQRVALLP